MAKGLAGFQSTSDDSESKRKSQKLYCQQNPFLTMVSGSRTADRRAKRRVDDDEEDCVTVDFCKNQWNEQGGVCFYCYVPMIKGAGVNRRTNGTGCTIERINNELVYYTINCVFACMHCNSVRGTVVPFEAMMDHGEDARKGVVK